MSKSNAPRHINGRRPGARVVAAILAAILVIASVEPAFAWAEAESEGEGSAPPGFLAGLEAVEPGGSETTLEEVAPAPGEEEVEEAMPSTVESESAPPVVSTEPTAAPEVPPPTPSAESPPTEAVAPTESTPSYEPSPEPSTPSYEPSAEPSTSKPVQNEAIVAPAGTESSDPSPPHADAQPVPEIVGTTAESPAPVSAPTAAPEPLAAAPAASSDRRGDLSGRRQYVVEPGDCLWSIATGLLPAGASNAEVGAEVALLWELNASRIGSGDPDLILVGTLLRLT